MLGWATYRESSAGKSYSFEFVKRHVIHITITAVAILLGVGHFVWPDEKIDAITLVLLVIAILPWLGTVSDRLKFPED